ncbi:hypothetical protein H0H93_005358 [Arthromyces matolae]|nr:hypothetical protein H0H93_005358 [Arthromyces matolae]
MVSLAPICPAFSLCSSVAPLHMFASALLAVLIPTFALAQYGGGPAPSPTSSAAPVVAVPSAPPDTTGHLNVDVAFQEQFVFHPSNFTAPNGTQVTFWFPDNGIDHSVTQSSFAAPCTYLAASGNNSAAGFDSGLQHAVNFTITIIDDTQPIWFHCKQLLHCGMGMVGSINAPSAGNTYANFLAAAIQIGNSEVAETGGPMTGGVNGIATAPPASDTTAASGSSAGSSNSGLRNLPYTYLVLIMAAVVLRAVVNVTAQFLCS